MRSPLIGAFLHRESICVRLYCLQMRKHKRTFDTPGHAARCSPSHRPPFPPGFIPYRDNYGAVERHKEAAGDKRKRSCSRDGRHHISFPLNGLSRASSVQPAVNVNVIVWKWREMTRLVKRQKHFRLRERRDGGGSAGRAGPGGAAGFTTDGFISVAEWLRFLLLEPPRCTRSPARLSRQRRNSLHHPRRRHGGDGWGGY